MKIGISGLGLIGGSMALAFRKAGATVLGFDANPDTLSLALEDGHIDAVLGEENMNECNGIFLAMPPEHILEWLRKNSSKLRNNTLVVDCCGIKRPICEEAFRLMEETDLCFVGGHPMAGRQTWGIESSREDLFDGASFVAVMPENYDDFLLTKLNIILRIAGFGRVALMSAEEHDRIIALTSQLSHIIPSAIVKSEQATAESCSVVGGSFRDMTRVAFLNATTWTELCLTNRDNLILELDRFMEEMEQYRKSLVAGDAKGLQDLFSAGSARKETMNQMLG